MRFVPDPRTLQHPGVTLVLAFQAFCYLGADLLLERIVRPFRLPFTHVRDCLYHPKPFVQPKLESAEMGHSAVGRIDGGGEVGVVKSVSEGQNWRVVPSVGPPRIPTTGS